MTKPSAMIFDLDGTLCNIDNRKHYIEGEGKKNWDEFYKELINDTPNTQVSKILLQVLKKKPDTAIIFLTGRPDKYRNLTIKWFDKHFGKNFIKDNDILLYMRGNHDFRPDYVMKRAIYEQQIEPFCTVMLAFDDHKPVIDMWHDLNVFTYWVKDGEVTDDDQEMK